MKRIGIFASLALIAGCKTLISTDVYTSDLVAAAAGEALTTPVVIGVEVSSDSECRENAPVMTSAIRTQFADAEFIGCETIDFNTFSRFRVQAEVINLSGERAATKEPFAIGIQKSGIEYEVFYLTNPPAVRAMWDALPEEMTQYRSFEMNPVLSAVLTNDLRDTITITTDDVFSDGAPVQGTQTREMTRRDQVELSMSDVTNTAFGNTENISSIVKFSVEN